MHRLCTETSERPNLIELQSFAEDPRYFHFIGMLDPPQPGVRILVARLEHDIFSRGTPRYELLKVVVVTWSRKEWAMISVPKQEAGSVQKFAEQCGLLVAQGEPIMNYPEGPEQFPISGNGENIFTLLIQPSHIIFSGKVDKIGEYVTREILLALLLNQRWDNRN